MCVLFLPWAYFKNQYHNNYIKEKIAKHYVHVEKVATEGPATPGK